MLILTLIKTLRVYLNSPGVGGGGGGGGGVQGILFDVPSVT